MSTVATSYRNIHNRSATSSIPLCFLRHLSWIGGTPTVVFSRLVPVPGLDLIPFPSTTFTTVGSRLNDPFNFRSLYSLALVLP
jgi:hypothetical protein